MVDKALAWVQGHAAAISCMSWSSDDARLASVGAGGACYQWDVPMGTKIAQEEYVDKQKNYCWVEFCSNNSTSGLVLRSLDGKLQHIQVLQCLQCNCITMHVTAAVTNTDALPQQTLDWRPSSYFSCRFEN